MNFAKEDKFREWLCDKLTSRLPSSDWKVLKGKNVADILICYQNQARPLLLFLEVKYYTKKKGRIGISDGKGEGYQVEYLTNKVDYLEKYLQWIIGDQESNSYLFLTNEEIRRYASAKKIEKGKQNNLSLAQLKTATKKGDIAWLSEQAILKRITEWIHSFADNSDILMPVEKRQAMLDSFYDD